MRTGMLPGGFVRRLDELGRVVLPIEWRRTFNLEPGTFMEIIPGRDGTLLLQRYVPGGSCTFCGGLEQVQQFAGRPVCSTCAAQLGALAGTPDGGSRPPSESSQRGHGPFPLPGS